MGTNIIMNHFRTEGQGWDSVIHVDPLPNTHKYFITAIVLSWSLLPVFDVRVLVTFHLTCVHIILSSVWVAEFPSFGK